MCISSIVEEKVRSFYFHNLFCILDIDECDHPDYLCGESHSANCKNSQGSFSCQCKQGYIEKKYSTKFVNCEGGFVISI